LAGWALALRNGARRPFFLPKRPALLACGAPPRVFDRIAGREAPHAIIDGGGAGERSLQRESFKPVLVFLRLLSMAVFAAAVSAQAADLPGSRDPVGLRRVEGAEIIHYAMSPHEPYFLARGEGAAGAGFDKEEQVEGAVERVVYKAPLGTTSEEIFHAYEKVLGGLGFAETFKLDSGALYALTAKDFQQRFYFQADYAARRDSADTPFQDGKSQYYLTARLVRDERIVNVAVYVVESDGLDWQEAGVKQPIVIRLDQPVIGVDVISSPRPDYRPVEVKAPEMAKALTDTGKVDIYGILFDTDKTDLKPESRATLEEVANLLKSDPALRLEVGGHTDSTGAADHNMRLSVGRAAAVVNALVSAYGIDRARLQPKGYGDTKPVAPNDNEEGRAKNRRVELRKL
jgi:outer membrane protein OmpA-like peptidoglycan-associated protein